MTLERRDLAEDRTRSGSIEERGFFVWLPEDLDEVASAAAVEGRWVDAVELKSERIPVVTSQGLPYGVDSALWRVRASDPMHSVPFVEQLQHAPADRIPDAEQQHLAERVLFVEPVAAWTPAAAGRFGAETARRAQQRLRQALDDAGSLISETAGWEVPVAEVERQKSCLSLVQELSVVWKRALSAHASGDLVTAVRSFAWAAAETRGYSATNYAASLGEGDEARARATSYLESRRWQARVLGELLGLESAAAGPDL